MRFLSAVFVLSVALTFLSGCGQSGSNSGVEVVVSSQLYRQS